ncbi:MAG: hypothetical protein KatS3mg108_0324 [Isosphaeraceae bacterium]|jgi:hypothetical protein|nr:MAG: hypothetical protein KatS3mg108_0324 [Isosphaeraceae bacterium]
MILLTIQGQTYNLDYLVKYRVHTGQREVATSGLVDPEPVFEDYRYIELVFADGVCITLDDVQTKAFLNFLRRRSYTLDLDRIDEIAFGPVVVHDTVEGGNIIFQTPEEAEAETRPVVLDLKLPPGGQLD